MSLQDPRWRIVIHYNWKAQLVPVLVRGLPTKTQSTTDPNLSQTDNWEALPMPSTGEIQAASPYAQVVRGRYRTPTFIVHGDQDDLIPWQQSQQTIAALNAQGVENGIAVPRDAGQAFDLWTEEDPRGTGWAAVEQGYDFICRLSL